MSNFEVTSIGTIHNNKQGSYIQLDAKYIPALSALEGFRHINVVWWFSEFDNAQSRATLEMQQPYVKAPETMGVFATRSPIRPNPIALSTVQVLHIDYEHGVIQLAYIDAFDQTPLLDIKPYTPSMDRVEVPSVPQWCNHWPKSLEDSASFAWESVFNF